jgi:hypothetical protein
MKVYIWWDSTEAQALKDKVALTLEELGLTDFVTVESTTDNVMKEELSISESSALIIEEESIDFKDMIFEWLIPESEELKSMFISIIGGSSGWWCGSKDDSGSCGTGCAC